MARTASSVVKKSVLLRDANRAFAGIFSVICALDGVGCKDAPAAKPTDAAKNADVTKDTQPLAHVVELSPEALKAAELVTAKAVAQDRATFLLAHGSIELAPSRVARVGPRVAGRVAALKVKIGDEVKTGAMLALIESVEVGRARAELLVAQAQLARAEKEVARENSLIGSRASTDKDLVAAQTTESVARIDAQAARERLRAYGAGPSPTAGGGVALSTPVAGRVLEMSARLGQSVGAADTLFVVGDVGEVWLLVDVHERFFPSVKQGDTVKVTVLALPGRTFEGRIDHLGGQVDPATKAFRARIVLANGDAALLPGMSASARVHHASTERKERVVVVPRASVQTMDGLPFVFVEKSPGHYEMRAIERGGEAEGRVEVLRGVGDGETVVADGSFLLKSEVLREQMGKND